MSALIWCPFPDRDTALSTANALLDERLIACANLVGPVESLFEWRGERGQAEEFGMLFKTDAALLDRAVARLDALHPYETPAVMGWRCDRVAESTAAWLGQLRRGDVK